jgi:hypothetical protein
VPGTTPAAQHAHNAMFNALTAVLPAEGIHTSMLVREHLATRLLTELLAAGASVHARPGLDVTTPEATPAALVDRLFTLAGPPGASRNVAVDRGELASLALTAEHYTRIARPMAGDLIAFDELTADQVAWRIILGILATTGTAAEIPLDVMPPAPLIEVISGWTLRPDISANPDQRTVTLTCRHHPMPLVEPTPGCVGPTITTVNVFCRGPADLAVHHTPTGGKPLTWGPVCTAHAHALRRAINIANTRTVDPDGGHHHQAAQLDITITPHQPDPEAPQP